MIIPKVVIVTMSPVDRDLRPREVASDKRITEHLYDGQTSESDLSSQAQLNLRLENGWRVSALG